ncbi:hypothetical protein CERSUDRAFT_88691 [Gelatoporia subvermispora B]|uniref:DUF6593 domain-containing protein n=1 Tax=Ceriporiopsis subvermispora (strain B) TaxID=914234 RepID=M2R0P7_CERS8|nr:hypothetical protein CERSUDRAFT_88691 [Gelatoporia subvermispora B]
MASRTLPYFLEDRSGQLASTELDDIYDRLFLRIATAPAHTGLPGTSTVTIYTADRRSSRQRDHRPQGKPTVVLDFGHNGGLGKISFVGSSVSMPMSHYLKKTAMFGTSLSRKFRASDGEEYKWTYRTLHNQEWTCMDSKGYIVAHYNLKSPEKPAFNTSGNVLTIYDPYAHLVIEILASLTIMRHIEAHNL